MKRYKFIFYITLFCFLLMTVSPAFSATQNTYIVQPGDTLFGIARQHNITVEQLAQANGLVWTDWLQIGQELIIPGLSPAPVTPTPESSDTYIVKPGDTLTAIAIRLGVSSRELAAFNGLRWNAWVFVGQRLRIPGMAESEPVDAEDVVAPTATPDIVPATDGVYIVQAGNTLFSIARVHDTTVAAIRAANGLASNIIHVGQELIIPNGEAPPAPAPPPQHGLHGEKWIDVNLTTQTVTAYEGQVAVKSVLASTGTWATPTVVGTYQIYAKYLASRMSGPGYDLPNVPHIMYFYRGYGLHGAYWHTNFGTPMSHGCVNLSLSDAEWFYNWAPMGTKVVTHY